MSTSYETFLRPDEEKSSSSKKRVETFISKAFTILQQFLHPELADAIEETVKEEEAEEEEAVEETDARVKEAVKVKEAVEETGARVKEEEEADARVKEAGGGGGETSVKEYSEEVISTSEDDETSEEDDKPQYKRQKTDVEEIYELAQKNPQNWITKATFNGLNSQGQQELRNEMQSVSLAKINFEDNSFQCMLMFPRMKLIIDNPKYQQSTTEISQPPPTDAPQSMTKKRKKPNDK